MTPPESTSARYPTAALTPAQLAIWRADGLADGAPIHNEARAFRLAGPLDVLALSQAFADVVNAHTIFRTRFVVIDGIPSQETLDRSLVTLSVVEAREPLVASILAHECRRPFAVQEARLLRGVLIRTGRRSAILGLVAHHLVVDAWTVAIFMAALEAAYVRRLGGEATPREPRSDFPRHSDELSRFSPGSLEFWKQTLTSAGPSARIPAGMGSSSPLINARDGGIVQQLVGADSVTGLHQLADQQGTTLAGLLLVIFQTLLKRVAGGDVHVGMPVAMRRTEDRFTIAGPLMNVIVCVDAPTEGERFDQALKRIGALFRQALKHSACPLEAVVDEIGSAARGGGLFDVMLAVQNGPSQGLHLLGIDAKPIPLHSGAAKYPLSLLVAPDEASNLLLTLEYRRAEVSAATASAWLEALTRMLASVVEDARVVALALPLPTEQDMSVAAKRLRAAETQPDARGGLIDTLRRLARSQPDKPAVCDQDGSVSYSELLHRAAAVAAKLSITPGDRVAVCAPRDASTISTIIAIWSAGGIYVPMDPAQPATRRQVMLSDSGAKLLITGRDADAAGLTGVRVLDPGALTWQTGPTVGLPDLESHAGRIAYLMYTSGSTGEPKAAAISHRALASVLAAVTETIGLTDADILLSVTSPSFDISLLEFFAPLWVGGTVWLAPDAATRDGRQLIDLVRTTGATTLQATPSLWRMLVQAGRWSLPHLRALCGGERMDEFLVTALRPRTRELWNMYGPTETTIWSFAGLVETGEPVTVGHALSNTFHVIVDERDNEVIPGSIGELIIGGAGVAEGYWRRRDLTSTRFVTNLFGLKPITRFYRTGDLVRELADGRLAVIGRTDDQVKIRGHRIEPGEVAAQLADDPEVVSAAVIAGDADTSSLNAFVVPAGSAEPDFEQIRARLRTRVPEVMIPSSFYAVPSLPLSVSGKVDRAALRRIAGERVASRRSRQAPVTVAESLVAEVWAKVLGVDYEAADTAVSFLDVGGNSMLAVNLLTGIEEKAGVRIALADFFATPTITGLAARLDGMHHPRKSSRSPFLAPPDSGRLNSIVPATHQQRQLWILERLNREMPVYNLATRAELSPVPPAAILARALGRLVSKYEVFRSPLRLKDGRLEMGEPAPAGSLLRVADLRALPVDRREAAATQVQQSEARRALWLDTPPFLRACLIVFDDARSALILVAHHAVMDATSAHLVLSELEIAFRQELEDVAPPEDTDQGYRDYAARQAQNDNGAHNQDRAYWRSRLDGYDSYLHLTSRAIAPAERSVVGRRLQLTPYNGSGRALVESARRGGTTPFAALLSSFATVLARYAQSDDMVIGVPTANRRGPGLDSVIGCVTNTIPMRITLRAQETNAERLASVTRCVAADVDRSDVALDELIADLGLQTDMSTPPLVQIGLVFDDRPHRLIRLGGSIGTLTPVDTGTAKYDLELHAFLVDGELGGFIEFASDRLSGELVMNLMTDLHAAIAAAAKSPYAQADSLTLPSTDTRDPRLSASLRQLASEHGAATSRFETWTQRTPDSPAIEAEGQVVTYGDLAVMATRTSEAMLCAGPRHHSSTVAVLLPPGVNQIVAMMATAKSGGTLTVLDVSATDARLRELVKDVHPDLVVTDTSMLPRVRAVTPFTPCVVVDDLGSLRRTETRWPAVGGDDPFCLVYTSGTTGRPKGIVLRHAAFSQFTSWYAQQFAVTEQSKVAQWAPFSYDAAYTEVLAALSSGGTLCLPTAAERGSPLAVLTWLTERRITHLQTIPSFFSLMTDAMDLTGDRPPTLEHVLLAGEVLDVGLANRWSGLRDRPRLHNLYGPTECILATHRELGPGETFVDSVPIGVEIPGRVGFVLDNALRPVPTGVVGELCLESPFLAGEYRGSQEQTSAAYKVVAALDHAEVYRTGDLVRRRPDGELEFVGRLGRQVKVRGNRVELEGVEAALRSHPAVHDAAVVARDGPRGVELAGFVVTTAAPADLKLDLAARLPTYAIPQVLTVVEALPRTPTNKRDLAQLTLPPERASGGVPDTGLVQLVTNAWREVLDRDDLSETVSFFEAGGDSMSAAHLQVVLSRDLGRNVSVVDIFKFPTIVELAAQLAGSEQNNLATGADRGARRRERREARAHVNTVVNRSEDRDGS